MPTDIDDLIIATLEGPSSPPSAFLSETSSPPADVPNDEVAPTQQSDATRSQGPAFFYRRRDQWIRGNYRPSKDGGALADGAAQAGVLSSERSGSLLSPAEAHAVTRQDNGPLERLGVILSMPRAIEDDDIWEDYLKSIHSKLVGGSTLKQGMSLAYAVSNDHDRLLVALCHTLVTLFMALLTHCSALSQYSGENPPCGMAQGWYMGWNNRDCTVFVYIESYVCSQS